MSEQNYLSLVELAKRLNKQATKLEKGKLAFEEINDLLDNSRDIYERLTIIRYRALLEKKEVIEEINQESITPAEKEKVIEESTFSFDFGMVEEEELLISPNQKNLLDEIDEIGSESTQEIVTESNSVNEKYATGEKKESLGEKLTKSKIKDLREAIALNQKFLFMNELFEGDKGKYDNALDKINACETLVEAKAFLVSDVQSFSSWNEESEAVQQFNLLIERKFV